MTTLLHDSYFLSNFVLRAGKIVGNWDVGTGWRYLRSYELLESVLTRVFAIYDLHGLRNNETRLSHTLDIDDRDSCHQELRYFERGRTTFSFPLAKSQHKKTSPC